MRVIFLDIDGVIATQGTYTRFDKAVRKAGLFYSRADALRLMEKLPTDVSQVLIDPGAAKRVAELAETVTAKIVVSSSWRETTSWPWLQEYLSAFGLYDKTQTFETTRGAEIDAWVREHGLAPNEFVILEDAEDCAPWNGRRVQTTFYGAHAGFQRRHFVRAVKLFPLDS